MEKPGFLAYAVIFLLALLFYILRREKREPKHRAKLPPGSMGWPYIGETLQLYSQDPSVFFAAKQKRYGEIFKTHILGCPCVMLASPEAARFVLVTQAHLFKPTYPKSKERLIGPSALFFHQGDYHNRLRKLVQGSLSPEAIRNLVADIEALAVSALDSWAGGHVFNTFHEIKKFSFEVGILAIFGRLEARYREELKKNYCIVDRGYNSFPTNIPGTPYKKALWARKRLSKILSELIGERKEKRLADKDLLGSLLNSKDEKGETLTNDQIADNIIGVLFAAQDTTASVMTWILKYLHDDPKLLEAVKAEQKAINKSNEEGNRPLTWSQTRNMPVTHKVILESLRMASIISFTFREAVADVEFKGYLIPKGWKVMPLFRNIHHDPKFFPDPQKFDPSRFEVAPKPNTFVPFGNGVHACPGNELAKLEMLIMTHHLVTKFRWEVAGFQSGIQYGPFPVPVNGLPARLWKQSTT
ncbi:abscisic acid 8'-hydroxylase CYP707A1-like isoform X2 [Vitis riparia]|uniref:abscisic acid 8'-hydroxylase CYP707A1-like isoform X2 n=1 Tax=Vitis riparia TaxID=96939 RepID=UPI00155A805B|nr:abscisic acid 8'-hydroxylase CYP707A1-like isoform X2 [Vitis riparia]